MTFELRHLLAAGALSVAAILPSAGARAQSPMQFWIQQERQQQAPRYYRDDDAGTMAGSAAGRAISASAAAITARATNTMSRRIATSRKSATSRRPRSRVPSTATMFPTR